LQQLGHGVALVQPLEELRRDMSGPEVMKRQQRRPSGRLGGGDDLPGRVLELDLRGAETNAARPARGVEDRSDRDLGAQPKPVRGPRTVSGDPLAPGTRDRPRNLVLSWQLRTEELVRLRAGVQAA